MQKLNFITPLWNKLWRTAIVSALIILPIHSGGSVHSGDPFIIAAAGTSSGGEYSQESREYHLKAAFLRYVAKFIEWPQSALPEGKINICVLGQVPYFEGINSINGKIVNDRAITISKIAQASDAKGNCQILYVAKTETDKIKDIVAAIQGQPILSFGDMEHFADQGGNMNFYIANNRLAIMANIPSVEKENLKINPEMLKLITVATPANG